MKGRLIGSSSLMVIGLLLAPAASAAEIGAVIQEEYTGAAGIRATGEQSELRYRQPVHAQEKVVTEAEEWTQLQFLDDSTLYVGAKSVVILDRFVYDPASQLGGAAIRLTKGAFRFVSGEMKNEEAIHLRTPKAALIIRGTTITAIVMDDGSELIDIDGDVMPIACPGGGSEAPVEVASGQAVMIDYMCNTTVGYASVSDSGPPELFSFAPIGGRGLGGGHENQQRGAAAGEPKSPPVIVHSSSSSSSYSPPDDGGEEDGDGCGDGCGGECGGGI